MKKSLIAMALMFGAVVFVASCSDDDKPSEACNCSWKVNQTGGAKAASLTYPNADVCPSDGSKEGQDVTGADAATGSPNKGGKYTRVCP